MELSRVVIRGIEGSRRYEDNIIVIRSGRQLDCIFCFPQLHSRVYGSLNTRIRVAARSYLCFCERKRCTYTNVCDSRFEARHFPAVCNNFRFQFKASKLQFLLELLIRCNANNSQCSITILELYICESRKISFIIKTKIKVRDKRTRPLKKIRR